MLKRLRAPIAQTPEAEKPQKPRAPKVAFEPGTVLRVELDDQAHNYARMLAKESWIAFYDGQFTTDEDPAEIVKRPVLFGLYVAPHAFERGRWRKIGHVPLNVAPIPIPKQFSYTPFAKTYQIVDEFWRPRPASPEECIDLEFAVVWPPEHVEERLRDHYAGRRNAHVVYLRPELKWDNAPLGSRP